MRQAIALDPGHALAWAWMARAYMNETGMGRMPLREGIVRARKAAEQALALEPDLAEGHVSLGGLQMRYDWDWVGADASYRRALALSPGNSDAVRLAGQLARNLGRPEEALRLNRLAVELDPLNASSHLSLGLTYRAAHRFEDAEAAFREALTLAPRRGNIHCQLGLVLMGQGKNEEALAEAAQEPEEVFRLLAHAAIHHAAGNHAESNEAIGELTNKHSNESAYQIAEAHAARGEVDAAFEWLDRAYASRDPGLADVRIDSPFDSIHGDPRWSAFLNKMGFGA